MKSITIIGTDIHGNRVSETIDFSDNKTSYSVNRYRSLGTERQELRLHFQRLSLWRRFVLRFFKKWPVVSGGIQFNERG